MVVESHCPPFDFDPTLTFWFGTVLPIICLLIGVTGNMIVLLVYLKPQNRNLPLVCLLFLYFSFVSICVYLPLVYT